MIYSKLRLKNKYQYDNIFLIKLKVHIDIFSLRITIIS